MVGKGLRRKSGRSDRRWPSEEKPVGLEKERLPDRCCPGERDRRGKEVMLKGLAKGQWMSTTHGKGADGSANKAKLQRNGD